MTKQEQIEEMRRKIYYARSKANGIATSSDIAEALYKAGYRKIDNKASLKNEIKHLNTIVERLDELLAKGIDEYIMGIDGVEGLKDMWERSSVREFADKLKTRLEAKEQHYICMYDWNGHSAVTDCENEVDELLKEYE